jgi:Holliday junction resolvase-like predicted endonuclease
MREFRLTYHRRLYKLWRQGCVHQVWSAQFTDLFRDSDVAIVRNQYQGGHHFGEWFTALHFWEKGYRVLIEKYAFRKHREDFQTAAKFLGQAGIDFLASNTRTLAQPPDLFVLDPEHNMYFFVEVKRERDRLRATQVQLFKEIEKRFHCQVLVVNLKAA